MRRLLAIVALLALVAAPAAAQITRTQNIANTFVNGVDSTTIALTGVAAGALLVSTNAVFSSSWDGTIAVSGGCASSWAQATSGGSTANGKGFIWYCANATGGSTTVTINPNGASADIIPTLSEYGGNAASPLDVAPTATTGTLSTGGATASIASGTLAQVNEVIVGLTINTVADDRTITQNATYTLIAEDETQFAQAYNASDKIVSSTSSDTADWVFGSGSVAGTWYAMVASFKALVAGGGGGGATMCRQLLLGVGTCQ